MLLVFSLSEVACWEDASDSISEDAGDWASGAWLLEELDGAGVLLLSTGACSQAAREHIIMAVIIKQTAFLNISGSSLSIFEN